MIYYAVVIAGAIQLTRLAFALVDRIEKGGRVWKRE